VAREYLKPDRLSVVLVGNVAGFSADLKGVGFNSFETVDLSNLDLTAADFKRPAGRVGRVNGPHAVLASYRPQQTPPRNPSPAPAEDATARTLLDRVISAKGGLERLKGITNIKAVTTTTLSSSQGPTKADATTYLEYPDRVRIETRLPEVSSVQVYDGERAWVRDPSGVHEVPDRLIRELRNGLKRDTIALLLAANSGSVRARLLPDVKDDQGRLHHALELSGIDLDPIVLYIDPDTNLVSKQTYVAGVPGQPLIEEIFSEYRMVDGVQVAYLAMVRRGGQPILERRVTQIVINSPLNPSLFKRPSS
jgi:outer membrane lipoprotein-sorting protein